MEEALTTADERADRAGDAPTSSSEATTASSTDGSAVVIDGVGLRLDGPRGRVYDVPAVTVHAGEVVALVGGQGSGRTAVLLTLAGRLRSSAGRLTVLGHEMPRGARDVHHHAALAHMRGIDDLDDGLTVGELAAERAGLSVPLWRRPLRPGDGALEELAALAYGAGHAPDWATKAWQLTTLQEFQTRLLIALIGGPRILVADDVDAVRDPEQQPLAWASLQRAAQRGLAVIGATTSTLAVPSAIPIISL